ncbi:MAG: serine protease [Acidobacteriota bacterium]|nr:MAG: serine protease [Acidobacteriota bacterium]
MTNHVTRGGRWPAAFLTAAAVLLAAPRGAQADAPAPVETAASAVMQVEARDAEGKAFLTGAGFLAGGDGLLVTSYHVVHNASAATAKAADGGSFEVAGVAAADKAADLAVLKLGGRDSPSLALGDSRKLEAGARVFTVGISFESPVSEGAVSAVHEAESGERFLDITAAIQEDSSGGPVVDDRGNVVGVATALPVEGGTLTFAVPVEKVRELLEGKSEARALADPWLLQGKLRSGEAEEYLDTAEGNRFVAEYLIGSKRYDEANPYVEKAFELAPEAENYFNRGVCHVHVRNSSWDSIRAFKEAVRLKPDFVRAHYYMGIVFSQLRRPENAINAYKEALRLDPDFAEAHVKLGASYLNTARPEEAVEACKRAARLKPGYARAHYLLGTAYLALDRPDDASKEHKTLKGLDEVLAGKLLRAIKRAKEKEEEKKEE